jgi:hypothetical protein
LFTLLDLCVSSLRRGHANLLCIIPILTDDPRSESEKSLAGETHIRSLRCGRFMRCWGSDLASNGTLPAKNEKADSTLRSSQAVPHPSTNRALRRLTSEVRRDPVYSTRYGRQRINSFIIRRVMHTPFATVAPVPRTPPSRPPPHPTLSLSSTSPPDPSPPTPLPLTGDG